MLVDVDGKKLQFFGFKRDCVTLNRLMESLKGRQDEMVQYLIAQARIRVRL